MLGKARTWRTRDHGGRPRPETMARGASLCSRGGRCSVATMTALPKPPRESTNPSNPQQSPPSPLCEVQLQEEAQAKGSPGAGGNGSGKAPPAEKEPRLRGLRRRPPAPQVRFRASEQPRGRGLRRLDRRSLSPIAASSSGPALPPGYRHPRDTEEPGVLNSSSSRGQSSGHWPGLYGLWVLGGRGVGRGKHAEAPALSAAGERAGRRQGSSVKVCGLGLGQV